jgi:glutathione S-transferase
MVKLYLGNKNYSSWSLRGWFAAKLAGAPFEEVPVQLVNGGRNPKNKGFSPSGYVPVLHDGDTVVWDTLAIAEYLAERHPGLWPADKAVRAWARSIVAEMHSSFQALRNDMTMCVRERVDVRPWSPELASDIARVEEIWSESRRRHAKLGPFLCGAVSLADAFYAPVAFRFQTYGVHPGGAAGDYLKTLLAHPLMKEWERDALAESTIIEADEPRVVYRAKLAARDQAAR